MSLLKEIERYDRERESYIRKLEHELEVERKRTSELTTLLMASTAANERKQLDLILSGHFDKLRNTG